MAGFALALPGRGAAAEPSASYAESVAISGLTLEGDRELSLRVGRFPGSGSGSLWASVDLGDEAWGAALYDLDLDHRQATAVENDTASFSVKGAVEARLARQGLSSSFSGRATARVAAHAGMEPPVGLGDQPLRIEASFEAWHEPVYPRPGRLELMGDFKAEVETPRGAARFSGVGAWHEQVGERPRFAPAFTYFKAMGFARTVADGSETDRALGQKSDHRIGVLASIRHGSGAAWGYAFVDNRVIGVETFDINGEQERRRFRVGLENGRAIEGAATRLRSHSVPIEGQRRPGTTVLVTSNVGSMVGNLNDWHPKEA